MPRWLSKGVPRLLALLLLVSALGLVAVPAVGTSADESSTARATDASQRIDTANTTAVACTSAPGVNDPPEDRLGWEAGCWYNDTLDIRREGGISERELRALAARAMARVEHLRGLEFRDPPVLEIRPRSSFDRGNRSVPRPRELRKNVRFEALYLVNGDTNAVRGGFGVGGYYAFWDNRVVLVSRNGTVDVHEFKLAHELVHVLQQDHFGDDERRHLHDRKKAAASLAEGEANYVTQDYKGRCRGDWEGECLPPTDWTPREERERGQWCDVEDPHFNIGRSLAGGVQYRAGPGFVAALRDRGGWSAVRRAYGTPPESTEQVIHPGRYPADRPRNVTVTDRSTDGWRVVRPDREGRPTHDRLGEAALYAMFWYQSFSTDHESPIIPCEAAYRSPNSRTLINYSHPVTAGWDGDALLPYAAADETDAENVTAVPRGYVWKLAWDRPADAREFAEAYRELLAIHGASPVSDGGDTYRIPETSGFAGVTSLQMTNATVLVVKGPSAEAVRAIRPGAVPEAVAREGGQADDTAGGRGPGVSVATALLAFAVLAAVVALARRRR